MTEYNNMSLREELETRFADEERRRQEEEFLSRGWQPPAEEYPDLGEQSSSGQRYTQAIRPPKTFGDYFADNVVDMAYGANRAVNGLSFGELDDLGNKLGYDTTMSDYVNLRGDNIKRWGDISELGGTILSSYILGRSGINVAQPYCNAWKIGQAYDRLKQNPFSGSGQDVIAKMKNHNGETVMLQRGEVIRGADGQIAASGKDLYKATGTRRNYGLNKAIYKHDVPRGEVTRLPKYIKNKPVESSSWGQNVYEVSRPDGRYRVVTSTTPKGKTMSSMYKIER